MNYYKWKCRICQEDKRKFCQISDENKWEWLDSNVSQLAFYWEWVRMARFQRFSVICKWELTERGNMSKGKMARFQRSQSLSVENDDRTS